MACLDEQSNVGVHEMHGHSNIFAVRENCASISPALLDEAEDVVPAKNRYLGTFIHDVMQNIPSTIETRGMFTEFE